MSERENWTIEVLNLRSAEQGAIKVSLKLVGKGVYKVLKFESGFIEYKEFLRPNHKVEFILQHAQ